MHISVFRGLAPRRESRCLGGLVALALLLTAGVSVASAQVVQSAPVRIRPPRITLTSPSKNDAFAAPATVDVAARATDVDGFIVKVDFYAGGSFIGSDSTSPYGVRWSGVAAGTYSLTAVAHDNAGLTTTSAALNVSVTGSGGPVVGSNTPPTVSLTSPADGTRFSAPATITLGASASDSDGTISTVEFYRGGTTQIGADTTSPYSITWDRVAAGSYELTAVARDNASGMTVSAATTILVVDPLMPSRALFTPSADHATNVEYYVVDIFPEGANPALANSVATQNIGKPPVVNGECAADVGRMIMSLAPGRYIATVSAFGPGGSTRSAAAPTFTR